MTLMTREAEDDLTEPSPQGDPDNKQSFRVWSRSSIGDKARSQTTCSQFHQGRLVELSNPSTSQYRDTLKQVMDYFARHGSSLAQAQQQAFAWIGQQVQVLAAYLAYIDVFWTLTVVSLATPARAHTAQGEARRTGAGQPL
jgi:hypothetical protein